jgi:hypothetical protein
MELPELKYDFTHAQIQNVSVGPRREVSMSIEILEWNGQFAKRGDLLSFRCGGINNFGEVDAFFKQHPQMEIAYLDYARHQPSKRGKLLIELILERTGEKLIIQCSSVVVAHTE